MIHPSHLTADRLKSWRAAAGWSQRVLAERAGVHVQTVKYHERQEGIIGGWAVTRFKQAFEFARVARPQVPGAIPVEPAPSKPKRLECGAKTRKGTPCRAKAMPGKCRCKFHGGMSTGPRTAEGKERLRQYQLQRWRERREGACALNKPMGARV